VLVTFKTDCYANITLFGDVALTFLRAMGHSGTVPGSLAAVDVPAALSSLSKALDRGEITPPESAVVCDYEDDDEEEKEPLVSLKNQAFPLIALLSAAIAAEASIMWE